MCDRESERANEAANKHGCKAVVDHTELLRDVDAVSIAVPTSGHFAVAMDFLEAGVDVLLEKPICSSLDEADKLIALAAKKDLILQIGHLERFNPVIRAIAEIIDRPRYIECRRVSKFHGRGTDTTVILDMMIHDIDHILSIVDSPIETIEAVGVPVLSGEEDLANARLRFTNGCIATVTASRVSWKTERTMRIFQHDAYIRADLNDNKLMVMRRNGAVEGEIMSVGSEERTFEPGDHLKAEIASFLDSVRRRAVPVAPAAEVRGALEAALTITDQLRDWRDQILAEEPDLAKLKT